MTIWHVIIIPFLWQLIKSNEILHKFLCYDSYIFATFNLHCHWLWMLFYITSTSAVCYTALHCSSTVCCVAIPLQYVGVAWWGATGLVLVTRLLGRWLYCSSALGRSANSAQYPRHNIQTGSIQSGTCLYKNILSTDYFKANLFVLLSCQYLCQYLCIRITVFACNTSRLSLDYKWFVNEIVF